MRWCVINDSITELFHSGNDMFYAFEEKGIYIIYIGLSNELSKRCC